MHTITSFHASAVQPEELSGIMADYSALERARIFRRLLVRRFAWLALAAGVVGGVLHWLPPFASWFSVGVFSVPPIWAWIVELRRERRLARRLEEVRGSVTHEVRLDSGRKKIVKKFISTRLGALRLFGLPPIMRGLPNSH